MKKYILILLLLLPASIYPQWRAAAIKLGGFTPGAGMGGFIVGYEGGSEIDPSLTIGWSIDWFHSSYEDKDVIEDYNEIYGLPPGSVHQLNAETNINDFPAMGVLSVKFPVAPAAKIFFSGALGGELLLISYRNFNAPDEEEMKAAFDFNWRLGFGGIYELNKRSEILAEINYHGSKPSWEYEINDAMGRKRVYEREIDMSGVMFRLGIRFYY